jgi:hypothetical protein
MENTINILCPCCDSKLVYTHSDRYQDLCEHVSQPNREPSIKPAFQCPNTECIANQCNVSWIQDGECYLGKRPDGIKYSELNRALEEKHGTSYAVNSWNWHYQLGKLAIKARQKIIRIGKYRIDIEPKEYGYDYPVEKQYQPRKFGWKFQYWKETEDGCYISITPTYRMVLHYIRSFKSSYNTALYNPQANRMQIKEALEYATGYRWGHKDDRSFAQISKFIIQIFMPNQVKIIKGLAKQHNIII